MKHLRRTIRSLILENQEHYEKLATLVCSQEIAMINQALDLAENMDMLGMSTTSKKIGQMAMASSTLGASPVDTIPVSEKPSIGKATELLDFF